MIPTLVLVGADKGGVGKTMVCRALLDYYQARGVRCAIFDTEPEPGVLRRFHPQARSIDMAQVSGQMTVLDGVAESGITVVDIRGGMLTKILTVMSNAGLLSEIKAGAMRLTILHILGSTEASLREIATAAAVLGGVGSHILVKNRATDGHFFEWDQETYNKYFQALPAASLVEIPHLDGMACDTVEKIGCTFNAFVSDEKNSRLLRGVVRHWHGKIAAEFDRVQIIPQ